MKTLRLGSFSEVSPQVCTSPFALEASAMTLTSEWAFGNVLFLCPGNAHLGLLFGPWSVDVEVWWPGLKWKS